MRIIPHSNGEDASPLHEFNPCHSPEDGTFCSDSKFSAGKMPMEGRAPNGYVIRTHDGRGYTQVAAGPRTIAYLSFRGEHQPGKLTRVQTSQVASEFQRKGWGVWLYKHAAEVALAAGASGIWSSGHGRNTLSDRVWASLERKGLAEKLESKGDRHVYRMPPAGGVKKLREFNACHSPDDGKFCSGEKTPGGIDRAAKVQRHKDLLEEIRPLAQKRGGGLTASEAAVFERKMLELEGLRFDLAKPFDGSKVRSSEERMSTLSVGTIGAARGDLLRNKDIYLAIAQGAIGVHYSKTTAIDNIMDGKNPKVSAEAFYENFTATRDALRAQYGDTMTLYRATGKQIAKATQNWATTFEFAAQFGPNVVKRKVPVDAIIAVNVSANGLYHELIVNARVIREARFHEFNSCHSPDDGKFCSGTNAATTRVGMTSARQGWTGRPARQVFTEMRAFERELRGIKGVTHVSVAPGVGGWDGGSEPSWVVSYRGNGEAKRLVLKTAKQFDQDGVLMLYPCRGANCDPAVDLRFDTPLGKSTRAIIESVLVGEGLGGWTWMKSKGHAVLRMVSVPAWGGDAQKHLASTRRVMRHLRKAGLGVKSRIRAVRAEGIGRDLYDPLMAT